MKGLLTKITAMLLVVWYSMSIIGFDIHTCSGSGESFVVTVDGFIVSDNVDILECSVVDEGFAVSDHNPVMLGFSLGEQA